MKKNPRYPAVVSAPSLALIEDDDDILMSAEEWMDSEFGAGAWCRDTWCDIFIAMDPEYSGPGVGYLTLDRQRRRSTTVVLPHQVH